MSNAPWRSYQPTPTPTPVAIVIVAQSLGDHCWWNVSIVFLGKQFLRVPRSGWPTNHPRFAAIRFN
jgi:hypothetical protein